MHSWITSMDPPGIYPQKQTMFQWVEKVSCQVAGFVCFVWVAMTHHVITHKSSQIIFQSQICCSNLARSHFLTSFGCRLGIVARVHRTVASKPIQFPIVTVELVATALLKVRGGSLYFLEGATVQLAKFVQGFSKGNSGHPLIFDQWWLLWSVWSESGIFDNGPAARINIRPLNCQDQSLELFNAFMNHVNGSPRNLPTETDDVPVGWEGFLPSSWICLFCLSGYDLSCNYPQIIANHFSVRNLLF